MTDRARPGLVALYDIQPGNRSGPFLQPRNPHGAYNLLKSHDLLRNTKGDVVLEIQYRRWDTFYEQS